MRTYFYLLTILFFGTLPVKAQDMETNYSNELSLVAGFQGGVHKNKSNIFGALYSLEYGHYYQGCVGFRTGGTYFKVDESCFNVSVPMYFSIRTDVFGKVELPDEEKPTWLMLFFLLPNRFGLDVGIRPGVTNHSSGNIGNRFSCSLHGGLRFNYCFGRVEFSIIPAYDYYITSDLYTDRGTNWSFLSFNGVLSFRLGK